MPARLILAERGTFGDADMVITGLPDSEAPSRRTSSWALPAAAVSTPDSENASLSVVPETNPSQSHRSGASSSAGR